MAGRQRNHDALDAMIAAATRSWGAAELERDLQAAGVEAAVVATARDLFFDAQLRHRGFFEPVPPPAAAPEIGARLHIRPAWRMSAAGAGTRHRAPEFAEHTDAVLRDDLGLTDEDVAGLEAEGVIARVPAASALARGGVMDLPALLQAGKLSAIDPEYRARLAGR
jgi:crotonobetainyl-CoA:carnitine CoA-transferase CaiB-like acyl-CoA transferase